MVLGDMLGSVKLSGMAGHSAVYGDRFSLVRGARSSLEKGSKSQYYLIAPVDNTKNEFNPGREVYNLDSLPIQTAEDYWKTIEALEMASSEKDKEKIV